MLAPTRVFPRGALLLLVGVIFTQALLELFLISAAIRHLLCEAGSEPLGLHVAQPRHCCEVTGLQRSGLELDTMLREHPHMLSSA